MPERIWDRFLSPLDSAHLAKQPHRAVGFGQKPALVLVDLYRAVFGDRPQPVLEAIDEWPSSCGLAAWQALPHIQRLLSVSREVQIPITHITMLTSAGIKGWGVPRGGRASARQTPPALHEREDLHEIIPELGVLPGEALLRKASPSAFWGTPLVAHLNVQEVDTLIVCGESTSGCVRATVVDGCTYRFKMIVVEECVFDRHEASHAINLFDMDRKYADVLPLEDVTRWLRAWRAGQQSGLMGDGLGAGERTPAAARG